jgi:hypothetical protein
MTDPASVALAAVVLGAVTICVRSIASAALKYQENKLKAMQGGGNMAMEARLERIEQAVDAIAVEVERISEGQRFTTKLLSERSSTVS